MEDRKEEEEKERESYEIQRASVTFDKRMQLTRSFIQADARRSVGANVYTMS